MIFLDSSFIVAYGNSADALHGRAVEMAEEINRGSYGTAVISDYVFDETMTVILARKKSLQEAVRDGERLLASVTLLRMDDRLFDGSWKRFKSQRTSRLSFTDCSTIEVCVSNGITFLASFDKQLNDESGLRCIK